MENSALQELALQRPELSSPSGIVRAGERPSESPRPETPGGSLRSGEAAKLPKPGAWFSVLFLSWFTYHCSLSDFGRSLLDFNLSQQQHQKHLQQRQLRVTAAAAPSLVGREMLLRPTKGSEERASRAKGVWRRETPVDGVSDGFTEI